MHLSRLTARRAILRLVLLRITKRPVLTPPIPEREFDPSAIPLDADAAASPTLAPSSPPSSLPSTPEHLKNNHEPLPLHPLLTPPPPTQSPQPVEDYLLPKALTTSSVKAPTALIAPLGSPKDWLSEIIYILRPLVYGECLTGNWYSVPCRSDAASLSNDGRTREATHEPDHGRTRDGVAST